MLHENEVDKAGLVMKLSSFFVICFCSLFCLLALIMHKTHGVWKYKCTTKHFGSHAIQNNVLGHGLFNIKQNSLRSLPFKRTLCHPILAVIILVVNKCNSCFALVTYLIIDRTRFQSMLLPLFVLFLVRYKYGFSQSRETYSICC